MKDAGLFFSTTSPGRLYKQLIYKSVTRVQIWWLILIPLRRKRKLQSAILIQKIYRASRARWWLHLEKLVKLNRRLLRQRGVRRCFITWRHMLHQLHLARRMIKRAMNMKLTIRWNAWFSFYEKRKINRQRKLKLVMTKMLNGKLWRCLCAWYDYVEQQHKVKRLMWKVLSGTKLFFFDEWAANVETIQMNRRRQAASIKVQKVWRGYVDRESTKWLMYRRTKLAVHAQRIVRGFLGRRHVYYLHIEIEQSQRKFNRKKQWNHTRGRIMNKHKMEKERLIDEKEYLDKVYLKALHDNEMSCRIIDKRGNITGKEKPYTKKEKAKALEMKQKDTKIREDFIKRHREIEDLKSIRHGADEEHGADLYSPPKVMGTKEYLAKARAFFITEAADKIKMNAKNQFRRDNPPDIVCDTCHATFHDEYGLSVHVCI